MAKGIKREFTAKAKDTVIVLKCCECGVKEEVALEDYYGDTGLCDECENLENFMEAFEVKVSVTLAAV